MNGDKTMETCQVYVVENFSRTPAGRYLTDGPRSGEAFRRDHLVPALQRSDQVVVYLDGVEGYGSSFLEEAFGGLVRVEGFTKDKLHQSLVLKSVDDAWKQEVWSYIDISGISE